MTDVQQGPVRVALIGSGRMGSFHGETLARRLPGAELAAVADPAPGAAERLAASLGAAKFSTDPAEVFADPDIDAVVIAAPARFHADLVVAAAAAGKGVFCEKPMAFTLADADRAIDAARAAGVVLQVGFNRRYAPDWAAARALLDDGRLGTPRLLRSVTRDPGGFDPARVAPNTIFNETLIHDFDALRFLNPGATAVEVFATATALVEPEWKDRGLLDTAVVVVRFDNGAVGTAEACFEASYGYDVRGEVFGSGGMATMGGGRRTGMVFSGAAGELAETVRSDQELLSGAYTAELAAFVQAVRSGEPGRGDRRGRPRLAGDRVGGRGVGGIGPPRADLGAREMSFRLAVSAEMVFTELAFEERVRRIDELGFEVEIWDWTQKDISALVDTGATFSSMTGYITGTLADARRRRGIAPHRRGVAQGRRAAELPAAERARHRAGRQGPPGDSHRCGVPGDVADRGPHPDPARRTR